MQVKDKVENGKHRVINPFLWKHISSHGFLGDDKTHHTDYTKTNVGLALIIQRKEITHSPTATV